MRIFVDGTNFQDQLRQCIFKEGQVFNLKLDRIDHSERGRWDIYFSTLQIDRELLNDDEVRTIGTQLSRGEQRVISEEEIAKVVDWANHYRIMNSLVDMIVAGQVILRAKDGDYEFAPDDKLVTESALAEVERLLKENRDKGEG